jgi:hypothetical protein
MRRNITCFIFILAPLCIVGFDRPAIAVESGTISITATVEPAKYVFVDDKMHITKIVSNTSQDAPIVPLSTSSPTQKVSLTPEISMEYAKISKQVNLLKYGQIYPQAQPLVQKKSRLVNVLAQIFRPFTMKLWI